MPDACPSPRPDGAVPAGTEDCRRRLLAHYPALRAMCRRACGLGPGPGEAPREDRSEELLNAVLEHLTADDYRVLRLYRGQAPLEGFLRVVVARQSVDLARRRAGRSRAREKARRWGAAGELVYQLVVEQGHDAAGAVLALRTHHGLELALSDAQEMVQALRWALRGGAVELPLDAPGPGGGTADPGDGRRPADYLPGPGADPEQEAARTERDDLIRSLLAGLDPEEAFLVQCRFGDGMSYGEIARLLGLREGTVGSRLSRLMERCRETLRQRGVAKKDV